MSGRFEHVDGKRKGDVKLYALSTCGWCKKTRELLDSMGVAYDYVYVDLLEGKPYEDVQDEIERLNPSGSLPIVCVGKKEVIVGFNEEKIKKALGGK